MLLVNICFTYNLYQLHFVLIKYMIEDMIEDMFVSL